MAGLGDDQAGRLKTLAILAAVDLALVGFKRIFEEVAEGEPLDPERAENLTAQCAQLRETIRMAREALQLAAGGVPADK